MTVHDHALARLRAAENARAHTRLKGTHAAQAADNRHRLRRHMRITAVLDVVMVAIAAGVAEAVRFDGGSWYALATGDLLTLQQRVYLLVTAATISIWALLLHVMKAYDVRVAGHGAQEYSAVARASLGAFTALALLSYVAKLDVARVYMLIVIPLGAVLLLLNHWVMRALLNRRRRRGDLVQTVLVVGDAASAESLSSQFLRTPAAGYRIVGVCSDDLDWTSPLARLGGQDEAGIVASRYGVDLVACAPSLDARALRSLGWRLEGSAANLMIIPRLTDVASPRITTRPMDGAPLMLVDSAKFSGFALFAKTLMDKVLTLGLLVVLAPVLALVALAVKLGDGGPVLFRQQRVGLNGEHFDMLKFRSMVTDAEKRLAALSLAAGTTGSDEPDRGPLFKLKDDPRITRVGKLIRRTSLDELPQLFNVLKGEMSLVGPRPPLQREVAEYDDHVHRRLLVRPGLTGLWQVSGRSNLTWEESVRYDLYYVENWSVMGDLMILFRTFKAVAAKDGAY